MLVAVSNLIMNVRSRRTSAAAHHPDFIPEVNGLPLNHGSALKMSVKRLQATAVINEYGISIARASPGERNLASRGSPNLCSWPSGQINARVPIRRSIKRVLPTPERAA